MGVVVLVILFTFAYYAGGYERVDNTGGLNQISGWGLGFLGLGDLGDVDLGGEDEIDGEIGPIDVETECIFGCLEDEVCIEGMCHFSDPDGDNCGDSICSLVEDNMGSCEEDCIYCGNQICDGDDTFENCPLDCDEIGICADNSECFGTEVCNTNLVPPACVECIDSCDLGEVCVEGNCVECDTDEQCVWGELCEDNSCVPDNCNDVCSSTQVCNTFTTPGFCAECMVDGDCTGDNLGFCEYDTCVECRSSSHCSDGYVCNGNICDQPEAGSDCSVDSDCDDGDLCEEGACVVDIDGIFGDIFP